MKEHAKQCLQQRKSMQLASKDRGPRPSVSDSKENSSSNSGAMRELIALMYFHDNI